MRKRKFYTCIVFTLVFSLGLLAGADISFAEQLSGHVVIKQSKQSKADTLRQQARDKAREDLGYERAFVFNEKRDRSIDFYVLGNQIRRLGELIQAMGEQIHPESGKEASFIPTAPTDFGAEYGVLSMGPGMHPVQNLEAVYGPSGPNTKSVRLLIEYRLMVIGNPRLAVGEISENKNQVTAQVITVNGALVEEYVIDKNTGIWRPVR